MLNIDEKTIKWAVLTQCTSFFTESFESAYALAVFDQVGTTRVLNLRMSCVSVWACVGVCAYAFSKGRFVHSEIV